MRGIEKESWSEKKREGREKERKRKEEERGRERERKEESRCQPASAMIWNVLGGGVDPQNAVSCAGTRVPGIFPYCIL